MICVHQNLLKVAVIVEPQRDGGVLDHLLFADQLGKNVDNNRRGKTIIRDRPPVADRERFRAFTVFLNELEKVGLLHSEQRLGLKPVYLSVHIQAKDFVTSSEEHLL